MHYAVTHTAGASPMAKRTLTPNAQRQAAYRARHLGLGGERVRLNTIVPAMTAGRLKRLAAHYGVTQIEALERALADAERRAVAKLSASDERQYYAATDVTP